MKLVGDARRRVVLDEINAVAEERRLAHELAGLRRSIAEARRLRNRHERAVRLPWLLERAGYVANDLARVRTRVDFLRTDLAE